MPDILAADVLESVMEEANRVTADQDQLRRIRLETE